MRQVERNIKCFTSELSQPKYGRPTRASEVGPQQYKVLHSALLNPFSHAQIMRPTAGSDVLQHHMRCSVSCRQKPARVSGLSGRTSPAWAFVMQQKKGAIVLCHNKQAALVGTWNWLVQLVRLAANRLEHGM